ncbi:4-hydroxy-3-methylbut-2-enyl diphosphate reductase [Sodalis sp. CWE]|uniref:4-hydroxy-3-methylbut-2-enyl diphosphate reductase n=1 Tax=Sodalis sp. CWE TaxID=2803816 RepID=UPI001C7D72E5|nr:4-hydroxy-3-methylbut-2-enyl diphosphate reductase [Sodalis sp. CWE]MBX4180724.1 4-hydroxy-3-methylbut-2-enyl diphosphate reductase [Sodalis sp. CWE]
MKVLLANPRGFCAGVDRAINIVERTLEIFGPPIYVRHEIVHNRYVVDSFRARGVIFVEKIIEVPDKAILIFSAHGVSQKIKEEARCRDLLIFDATCPLVTKVHKKIIRASQKGMETILIGHSGHPEVEGTMGQYNNLFGGIYLVESVDDIQKLQIKNENNLCFMTQTTLSVNAARNIIDALRTRFPAIVNSHKNDICYATINRQKAVRDLSAKVDIMLVIGSKNSSNSNRLAELVQQIGKPSHLIENATDIQESWFRKTKNVGITAGASAPEILVNQVVRHLCLLGAESVREFVGKKEKIVFKLLKKAEYKKKFKAQSQL